MGLHHSRTRTIKITAVSLWVTSLGLLTFNTAISPHPSVECLVWALWIQMCAWRFTAWWISDSLHRRSQVRVADLAEIMARVAVEDAPQSRGRLHRIH